MIESAGGTNIYIIQVHEYQCFVMYVTKLFHQSAICNVKIIVLSLGMSKTSVTWTNFRLQDNYQKSLLTIILALTDNKNVL